MRERMGFKDSSNERKSNSPRGSANLGGTGEFERDEDEGRKPRTHKRRKSVKIKEKENHVDNELPPRNTPAVKTFVDKRPPSRGKSRSISKKREESPIYESPRQKLYEAKFEKYLANKEAKMK
jgi:hypothetical protein